jgi:hypothetical protein
VHNERVRSPSSLTLVALTTAAALVLGGCSDGDAKKKGSSSASSSPSPSSTVKVPDATELTSQGSKLDFGDSAQVIFESTQNKGSVLKLTVQSVQQGRLADFKDFILDDPYKEKASYYYAKVAVENVGEGDVGGVPVPLWGVNESNTLLPAVDFTSTTFKPCPSKPLPATFAKGAKLSTCLVYLAPNRGKLEAVSYRPSQQFNPITWTGTVAEPTPVPKPTKKKKAKKKG